jgi:hypothetical protein
MKQTLFTLLVYLLTQSPLAAQVVKPANKPKPTTTRTKPAKRTPAASSDQPPPVVTQAPEPVAIFGQLEVAWKGDRTVKLIIDRQEYDMMPNSSKRIDVHANEIIEDFCIKTVEGTLRPLEFLIIDKGKGYLELSAYGKNLNWVYESDWARKEKLAEAKRIADKNAAEALEEQNRVLAAAKASAESSFKSGNWGEALVQFRKWGSLEGYTDYINKKIAICNEESAWKKYTNTNYVAELENYMTQYKGGKYYDKATEIYLNYYSEQATAKARSCDLDGSEAEYVHLTNLFPNNEKTIKTKEVLCNLHEQCGDIYAKTKKPESQKNALRFYLLVKYSCANNTDINNKINTANGIIKLNDRPNKLHVSYSNDGLGGKGVTFAGVNINEAAVYLSFRFKNAFIDFYPNYEVNTFGVPNDPYYMGDKTTGRQKIVHMNGTIGLTKRIYYPFWGYAGIGLGQRADAKEMNNYTSSSYDDLVWAKIVSEKSQVRFLMEAGILLDFKFVSAGFGILRNGIDPVYRVLTIGFSFNN